VALRTKCFLHIVGAHFSEANSLVGPEDGATFGPLGAPGGDHGAREDVGAVEIPFTEHVHGSRRKGVVSRDQAKPFRSLLAQRRIT
jgi:hypothetical protein